MFWALDKDGQFVGVKLPCICCWKTTLVKSPIDTNNGYRKSPNEMRTISGSDHNFCIIDAGWVCTDPTCPGVRGKIETPEGQKKTSWV